MTDMTGHEWAKRYEVAIAQFEKHLKVAVDGTLRLDVEDGKSIGVDDPIVFADLKRSLEETNRKIKRGELSLADVTGFAQSDLLAQGTSYTTTGRTSSAG
jgi:hypothetical protein